MTYARARLLLGMLGVGLIVLLSLFLLLSQKPLEVLPTSPSWSTSDAFALVVMYCCLVALLFPLDLLGGFLLPNRWRPNTITIGRFLVGWLRGVSVQGLVFVAAGLLLLAMGRWLGVLGAALAIACIAVLLVASQLQIAKFVGVLPTHVAEPAAVEPAENRDVALTDTERETTVAQALSIVSGWGWEPRRIRVLQHRDTGFTGGIVGLPGGETIVLPAGALRELSPEQLAVTIARRLEAIRSGSRTRGLLFALVWVVVGFTLSTLLPGATVTSVGGLAMTSLGFTLWTFLGLLTLPTLSRQASYAIDGKVLSSGVSTEVFQRALKRLDKLQDDEPERSILIETIFHPVPSVDNRRVVSLGKIPVAWHAARMTLFVSWACMGMLVRAVHCNVGRPELWVMLPTD